MIEVKAPGQYDWTKHERVLFLGGSIEMWTAEKWQERLVEDLKDYGDALLILNPRRDDWDSSWKQDPTKGTAFHEQVTWELDAQDNSNIIVYYFDTKSKSPITLLELGLYSNQNVYVCCPKEFYRYGNVKVVCNRWGLPIVETYDELLKLVREDLDGWG
jgi:hypothetical protein